LPVEKLFKIHDNDLQALLNDVQQAEDVELGGGADQWVQESIEQAS